jgi:hypothetical protein
MNGTRAWPALRGISRDASKAPITESWNPLRAGANNTGAAGYWNSFVETSVGLSKVYDKRITDNEAARRILLPDFKRIDGSVRKVASRANTGVVDSKRIPKYAIAGVRRRKKPSDETLKTCRIGLVLRVRISSLRGAPIPYKRVLRGGTFDNGAALLVNMLLNSRALLFIARVLFTSSDNYTRYSQQILNFSEEAGAVMALVRAPSDRTGLMKIIIDNDVDSFTAVTKLVDSWNRSPFRVPECEWFDGATDEVKGGHLRDVVNGGLRDALIVRRCQSTEDVATEVSELDGTKRAALVLEFVTAKEIDVRNLANPIACRNGSAKLSSMLVRHLGNTRLAVFNRIRGKGRRGETWTVSMYGDSEVSKYDISRPIQVNSLLFDVELESDSEEIFPIRPETLMVWDPRARKNKVKPSKSMMVDNDKDDVLDAIVSEDSENESGQDSPHSDESE